MLDLYPLNNLFTSAFDKIVSSHPERIAIIADYGSTKTELSFKELNERSNKLANYLVSLNLIGPNSLEQINQDSLSEPIIGISSNKSDPNWIISLLAAWKVGCAVLLIGQELTHEDALYRLQNVKVSAVITDGESNFNSDGLRYIDLSVAETVSTINGHDKSFSFFNLFPEQLAYIAYTSGSTGQPKAIAINHRGIMPVVVAHQEILDIQPGDKVLQFSRFSFDACYMEFLMLSLGICLVLESDSQDIRKFLGNYIQKHKINIAILVPSVLQTLSPESLPTLKAIVSTGEAGNEMLFSHWKIRGKNLTERIVVNGYGPAECTIGVTLQKYSQGEVTLGDVISSATIVLLNSKENKLNCVPAIQEKGKSEIAILGNSLARGYVLDGQLWQENNDESFITIDDSQSLYHGKRAYRTGDLAHYNASQELICDGRKDRQLKIYGMRIESCAIENFLRKALAELAIAFKEVYVVPRYLNSRTIETLAAFILNENSVITTDIKSIRQQMVKSSLFKAAIPSEYYVITPQIAQEHGLYTKSNKISYKNLEEQLLLTNFLNSIALSFSKESKEIQKPVLTQTEEKIYWMWQETLHLHPDYIIDIQEDEFYILGGNSLLVANLIDKLEKEFKVNLGKFPIFKQRLTIENLAETIVRRHVYSKSWNMMGNDQGNSHPPIFLFHSILGLKCEFNFLAHKIETGQSLYVLSDPMIDDQSQDDYLSNDYKNKFSCKTIEEIVSFALYGLRKIQPCGHYFIGGFSFGGILAFEAAKQLILEKKTLQWLGIIDSAPPSFFYDSLSKNTETMESALRNIKKIIENCAENMRYAFRVKKIKINFNIEADLKIESFFSEQINDIQNRMISNEKLKESKNNEKLIQNTRRFFDCLKMIQRNLLALIFYTEKTVTTCRFSPKIYTTKDLGYFFTESKDEEEQFHLYRALWQAYFEGKCEIITIHENEPKHEWILKDEEFHEQLNLEFSHLSSQIRMTNLLDYTSHSKYWHIPDHYPHFTGRKSELAELRNSFKTATTVVIAGFGGLGKTKLALKFVECAQEEKKYDNIIWFISNDSLQKSFQEFFMEKFRIQTDNITLETLVNMFYEKVALLGKVLIVFDDVITAQQLRSSIREKRSLNIHILITARDSIWPKNYNIIHINALSSIEAEKFLKRNLAEVPEGQIAKLAEHLQNYPLALNQAVNYLNTYSRKITDYLELVVNAETRYLANIDETMDPNYQKTLIGIVMTALDAISIHHGPEIIDFIYLISFLYHNNITDSLLQALFKAVYLKQVNLISLIIIDKKITEKFDNALQLVIRNGLMSYDTRANEYYMHLLIQRVIIAIMPNKNILLMKTIEAIGYSTPRYNLFNQASETLYCQLQSHLTKLIMTYFNSDIQGSRAALLLIKSEAEFLSRKEKNCDQAINIISSFLKKEKKIDKEDLFAIYNSYAEALCQVGRVSKACKILNSAITMTEQIENKLQMKKRLDLLKFELVHCSLMPYRVGTAIYNNEVNFLMLEKLLDEIIESEPDNGAFWHERAILFSLKKEFQIAYVSIKKALDFKGKKYGVQNIQYASSLHELSSICYDIYSSSANEKMLQEAKENILSAYEIKKKWYNANSENEDISVTLSRICITFGFSSNPEDLNYLKNLLVDEITANPNNADCFDKLAEILMTLGDFIQAYDYYKKSLKIRGTMYNCNPIDYAKTLKMYSWVCALLGKLKKAKKGVLKAYQIYPLLLEDSKKVGDVQEKMMDILIRCGDFYQAMNIAESMEDSKKKLFIFSIVKLYNNLAIYDKSIDHIKNFFKIERYCYSNKISHINYNVMKIYHGKWYICTGKYKKAEDILDKTINSFNSKSIYNNKPCHNTMIAKLEYICSLYKQAKYSIAIQIINEMLRECLTIYPDKKNTTYAKVNYYSGCVSFELRNNLAANDYLEIALKIQREIFDGLNHPDLAETLRELAKLEISNLNFEVADNYINEALSIQFLAYGKNPHPEIAETYGVMATLAFQQGNISLAINYQKQALIYIKIPGVDKNIIAKLSVKLHYYCEFEIHRSTKIQSFNFNTLYHQSAGILFFSKVKTWTQLPDLEKTKVNRLNLPFS